MPERHFLVCAPDGTDASAYPGTRDGTFATAGGAQTKAKQLITKTQLSNRMEVLLTSCVAWVARNRCAQQDGVIVLVIQIVIAASVDILDLHRHQRRRRSIGRLIQQLAP